MCDCFIQTSPKERYKERKAAVCVTPDGYHPRVLSEMAGEGAGLFWQRLYFPDRVLLRLAQNDAVFPEHGRTDRWCERTRITRSPSGEPAWNANVICSEVKQGKSRAHSKT